MVQHEVVAACRQHVASSRPHQDMKMEPWDDLLVRPIQRSHWRGRR
jgi:hypothetical protein